jgi:type II secretory pathway component PulK
MFTMVLILVVALLACMTADFILDMETIWNNAGHQLIGTQQQTLKVADISWVQVTLDSQESEPEINVIELAKEQMTPKLPNPGDKLWETLDAQFEQSKCKDLDYNSLTVKELKIIAKERAIPKYGSMRKSELIAALQS